MDNNTNKGFLKKSYKPLFIWFLLLASFAILYNFVLNTLSIALSSKATSLLWLCFVNLMLVSLFLIIYKTERVYYINYVTYKEALEASGEERKAFAYKHLVIFGRAAAMYWVYSAISLILTFPLALDIGVFLVIIIVSAIRTISIRLNKK